MIFTITTSLKIRTLFNIRKKYNVKVNTVVLPENINDNVGYRLNYYRDFLVVMKKYRLLEESLSLDASPSSTSLVNNI